MGYNQASAFALVAVILFAAANPLTHAQQISVTLLPPVGSILSPILSQLLSLLGLGPGPVVLPPQSPILSPLLPPPQNSLNSIIVIGNLTCPTGTGLPGPGIPGVTVKLNCTNLLGANVTLGQATTGANGSFNITATNLSQPLLLIGSLIPCRVVVQLPLQQTVCPLFNDATGFLQAVPLLVSTILSPVFGLLGTLVANTFVSGSVSV